MDFTELVEKKIRDEKWTADEIKKFVSQIVSEEMSPAQLGSMLMLIRLKRLEFDETANLTRAMTHSGVTLDWPPEILPKTVDKHSTGGVGDKVSLILLPTAISLGAKVPMISGRALGFTGGTLDKIESIPGFSTNLTDQRMRESVASVGGFLAAQTEKIVPADAIMYRTRSECATIISTPLIVASILSKKAAEGVSGLVMDVKFGRAAFMPDLEHAKQLAENIKGTAEEYGIKVVCLLTEMNRPLGHCVGNALEVAESLQILNNRGPKQLRDLVCEETAHLLLLAGQVQSLEAGRSEIQKAWSDGSALDTMRQLLVNQGVGQSMANKLCQSGDFSIGDYLAIMGREAECVTELECATAGYVCDIEAKIVAQVCSELCNTAGSIDYSAGVQILVQMGQYVRLGDKWMKIYHSKGSLSKSLSDQLNKCISIKSEAVTEKNLIHAVI